MRILHIVQFYHPAVGGMEEVAKQISEGLSNMGHSVAVLTSSDINRSRRVINKVNVHGFSVKGNFALGLKGEVEKAREFILSGNYDVITCFAAQQWGVDILLKDDFIKNIKSKLVFVPTGFSNLYNEKYRLYFKKMKKWISYFDASIFLSDDYRDINFFRENNYSQIHVIPNGASEKEFKNFNHTEKFEKDPLETLELIHVGNHTGQKGHEYLFKLYKNLKVRSPTRLTIIGTGRATSRCLYKCYLKSFLFNFVFKLFRVNKCISVKNLNRKETLEYFKKAHAFLFFSKIECSPIVLFESMASCTPFFSSDVGNSIEIVDWSEGGIVLPTLKNKKGYSEVQISPSLKIIESILNDTEKLKEIAIKGNRAWKNKFTWKEIALKYEKLYLNLCANDTNV